MLFGSLWVGDREVGENAACELPELEFVAHLTQHAVVGLLQQEGLLVEGYRGVEADGGQLLRKEGIVGMLAHLLTQLGVLDFVDASHHLFYRAELCNQLFGGLLPHSAYARDVVDGVAPKAKQVYDLGRRLDIEFGLHLVDTHNGVGAATAAIAVHVYVAGHKLGEVFVGRNHHHLVEASLLGIVAQSANHIVGLEALTGELWYAEGLDYTLDPGQVALYLLGHGVAVGLVVGIHLVAECRLGQVESHPDVGRPLRAQQVVEVRGEAEGRRGVEAFGVDAGRTAHGIVATVDGCHTVYQE